MCNRRTARVVLTASMLVMAMASPGVAQVFPWDLFQDPFSDSLCDVVNAANAELVILSATGEFVIVTGEDVTLEGIVVDFDGSVFLDESPAGLIAFATDGDGFRTLWWMSLTGLVINVDDLTGEPTVSDLSPGDFVDVGCDACAFWDDTVLCGDIIFDRDLDGIDDDEDFCADTPPGEAVDDDGCSCSQLDDDLDGVDDCTDLCPGTLADEEVNVFGCLRSGGPVISLCGSFSNLTLAMMACGLVALRLTYRPT